MLAPRLAPFERSRLGSLAVLALALAILTPFPKASAQASAVVDASTLNGKLVMGYQGWFSCAGDGGPVNDWRHWSSGPPVAGSATFDLWPDTSELDADELFPTSFTRPDGVPASLFSSWNQKTVVRHFQWMQENGIDGVLLQRFLVAVDGGANQAELDGVATNVRAGAEQYGRVFGVMYDLSGKAEATLYDDLKNDWTQVVDRLQLTQSARYLNHRGKPLVAIWGVGFNDAGRPTNTSAMLDLIQWFQHNADPRYQATVMLGVPEGWRTLSGSSQTSSAWTAVYHSADVLSPWTVGRYSDTDGADDFASSHIAPDLAECTARGIDYLPVVFPGFSWHNLMETRGTSAATNQVSRHGGSFYWRQIYNSVNAGCHMIYNAMFDECDEGTAMFKAAPTAAQAPSNAPFLALDADGMALPSDWYLRLAGEAGKVLRGVTANGPFMPIAPAPGGDRLKNGQSLQPNGSLVSASGAYRVVMQGDGNLVLSQASGTVLWASGTATGDSGSVFMQGDGNLVLYRVSNGGAAWSSKTGGQGASTLVLQDDGNLVIYGDADGHATWASNTAVAQLAPAPTPTPPPAPTDRLLAGGTLGPNGSLTSADGRYHLVMQSDGNLVLYDSTGAPLWASGTASGAPAQLVMQNDGNLVVYALANLAPTWSSRTSGQGPTSLVVQDDGNVVLYRDSDGHATWAWR